MKINLRYEFVLLIVAMLWLIVFSYILQFKIVFNLNGDEGSYYYAAKKVCTLFLVDDGRPLVISAIMGIPFLFNLEGLVVFKWIFVVNSLCWLATVYFLFKTLLLIVNRKEAFYFSLLFVFALGSLAITYKLLAESVFTFSIIYTLYFFVLYHNTKNYNYFTIAISLSILTIIIKPITFGLVIIMCLYSVKKIKHIVKSRFILLVIISISLVLIQMIGLKRNYGNFTVSYIGSFTYYNYLGTRAQLLKENKPFEQGNNQRYRDFIKLNSSEQSKLANKDFVYQLQNNSLNFVKAYITNLYINSSKGSTSIYGCENFSNNSYFKTTHFFAKAFSKIQNILFTIFGIVLSIFYLVTYKNQQKFIVLIAFTIIYLFAISGLSSDQGDRFHIVFFPLVIVLISYGAKFLQINRCHSA